MTIQAIYDHYQLMPNLQVHQYRVAGVAKLICDNLTDSIDTDDIVKACLLHDMGNIIKFKLGQFPEFLAPQGLEYWQNVQNDFKQKYGDDEHEATFNIARELKVSDRVFELIAAVGFDEVEDDFNSGDLGKMICEYADCRVAPMGVVSLEERLEDLERRYGALYSAPDQVARRKKFQDIERQMEGYIFERATIKPHEISDQSVEQEFERLKQIQL